MNPLATYRINIRDREPFPKLMWDWSNGLHYSKYRNARVRRAKAKKKAKK